MHEIERVGDRRSNVVHRRSGRYREVLLRQPMSGPDLSRNPLHASLIEEWTPSSDFQSVSPISKSATVGSVCLL